MRRKASGANDNRSSAADGKTLRPLRHCKRWDGMLADLALPLIRGVALHEGRSEVVPAKQSIAPIRWVVSVEWINRY